MFFGISAIGWIIDFSIYLTLTYVFDFEVSVANFLGAVPAISFVFFMSTKKTFVSKDGGFPIFYKYVTYFGYQMILLLCVSLLNQYIYEVISTTSIGSIDLVYRYAKVISKVIITPITMCINFAVMKVLIERV